MKGRLLIFFAVVVAIFSCKHKSDFKTLPGSIQVKLIDDKGAPKAKVGDHLKLNLAYYTDADSLLYSSTKKNKNGIEVPVMKPQFNGDLMEGFTCLGTGDSAVFRISVDSFFKHGNMPAFFKPGQFMKVTAKCMNHYSSSEYKLKLRADSLKQISKDDSLIQDYISKKHY